jgi:hypothetical protein
MPGGDEMFCELSRAPSTRGQRDRAPMPTTGFASAPIALAPVIPSLKHRRDDPDALAVRMVAERRNSIRQKIGGRHDRKQLAHGGER